MTFNDESDLRSLRHRTLAIPALAVVAAATISPAAHAASKSWGTLTVSSGGAVRGQANGTASTTTASIKNTSSYNGTPTVGTRVETTWAFLETSRDSLGQTTTAWTDEGRGDTPTSNSTSRRSATVSRSLLPSASQARAMPRICTPKPWGVPVACSGTSILTFSY